MSSVIVAVVLAVPFFSLSCFPYARRLFIRGGLVMFRITIRQKKNVSFMNEKLEPKKYVSMKTAHFLLK